MAITTKIDEQTAAVSGATTEFVTTGPFVFHGRGFGPNKTAKLIRVWETGVEDVATNKGGEIMVTDYPNMVYVEAPGTWRIDKMATDAAASVGYEEV